MKGFVIFSDSTCDLPEDYVNEHNIVIIPLFYNMENVIYGTDKLMDPHGFYDKMKSGVMPTTMASNPEYILEKYNEYLDKGYNILHICFSSALSGSCNNAFVTARELRESRPDANVMVVDSLAASMGQGLMVYKAVCLKESGASIDDVYNYLEKEKMHFCHQFTVEDLFHLHRGGRVSKAEAVIGTMINLKPVLHVDEEGRLIPIDKVRGRKKSLSKLVDNMEKMMGDYKNQNDMIMISHGDSLDDANFVADLIKERFGIDKFMINYVCPTIGAHSGPGTIALFFMADAR